MAIDQKSVQGSVTLRKLRSGATASISLSSTMQLFQLFTKSGSNVDFAPNWETGSHPVVTVNATTSSGSQIYITNVVWTINGQNVTTLNSPGTSDKFEVSGSAPFSLTIKTNVADTGILNFNSGTLAAQITYTDGIDGPSQTITKTETIRVQEAVEGGYTVFINTNGKNYVDANGANTAEQNAVLTAECYYGLNPYSGADLAFKWYDSTTSTTEIKTAKSLDVTPDMVNGSQLFICRAFVAGNEVDAEGVVIIDNSDPLIITAKAQQYKGGSKLGIDEQKNVTTVDVGDANDSTMITFSIINSDGSAYTGANPNWVAQKRHAGTMGIVKQLTTGTAPNVTVLQYTSDYLTSEESSTAVTDGYGIVSSSAAEVSITVYEADFYTDGGVANAPVIKDEVICTATATLPTT